MYECSSMTRRYSHSYPFNQQQTCRIHQNPIP
jgi:hypothetical protein